jgi:hypothetical protein
MNRVRHVRALCVRALVFSSAVLVLSAIPAQAGLIGTIDRDYGIGKVDPGGNDVLGTDWVTVSDQSSGRFSDVFDFSSLAYVSISHFELTLTFDSTGDGLGIPFGEGGIGELWRVRPASSTSTAVNGVAQQPLLTRSASALTQTFVFNSGNTSSNNVFNTILANQVFFLWFNESGSGAHSYNLHSASLAVFGESAPASVSDTASTMLLFGVGFGLIAGAARLRLVRQHSTAPRL